MRLTLIDSFLSCLVVCFGTYRYTLCSLDTSLSVIRLLQRAFATVRLVGAASLPKTEYSLDHWLQL